MSAQLHTGGCQCGAVRYEVTTDVGEVLSCNCSRCGRLGSLLAFAPVENFKLLKGEGAMSVYKFNKHMISHKFCTTCGIQSFGIGKAPNGAEMVAINARCLDDVDVDTLTIKKIDGKKF